MDTRNLEQTVIRQAFELTQANERIASLEQAHDSLRQFARDNQNEITKLRNEADLLEGMRQAFRRYFRDIPAPFPLRDRKGVVKVSHRDFEISANGIACVVDYELDGSTYSVDFVLVPIPNGKRCEDLYPGHNFNVWTEA